MSQVVLVGHSAGGWLGRAYLADPRYQHQDGAGGDDAATSAAASNSASAAAATSRPPPGTQGSRPNPRVRAMVTLGTPQRPPPAEKKRDMTGEETRQGGASGCGGHDGDLLVCLQSCLG